MFATARHRSHIPRLTSAATDEADDPRGENCRSLIVEHWNGGASKEVFVDVLKVVNVVDDDDDHVIQVLFVSWPCRRLTK